MKLWLLIDVLLAQNDDWEKTFYKLDGLASMRVKAKIEHLFSEGTHLNHPEK